MRKTICISAVSALAATLALTAPAAAQSGVIAQPSDNSTEVVCRRLEAPTGSRLGRRNVCKTQTEWDAIQAANREEVQRQQDASHWSRSDQ